MLGQKLSQRAIVYQAARPRSVHLWLPSLMAPHHAGQARRRIARLTTAAHLVFVVEPLFISYSAVNYGGVATECANADRKEAC